MITSELLDFYHNKDNRSIFILVYVLALLSFSYLFVGTVYNNHDLPMSFYHSYPSWLTFREGRFIGDILLNLFGGLALPALNMVIAVAIQILNGFLLAECLGITRYWAKLSLITIVTIHPALADYYSWGGFTINFCLSDTFAIVALYFCSRNGPVNLLIATIFVVFCVATYQAKVSILATIFSLFLISKILTYSGQSQMVKNIFLFLGKVILVILASMAIYFTIYNWTVTDSSMTVAGKNRLHLNSFAELIPQLSKVAEYTRSYFFSSQNFLHPNDYFIPTITVVCFVLVAFTTISTRADGTKEKLKCLALFFPIFFLLPFSMNLVFLITNTAYATHGRFFATYAYVLAFFLAYIIEKTYKTRLAYFGLSIFAGLAVFFVFDNAQYSYRGYMQNRFEYSYATRITARIENIIEPHKTYRLVFLGNLPWKRIRTRMSRGNNMGHRQVLANYDQPGFIHYRRVEYLNFLMGRVVFAHPNAEDITKAKNIAITADPWPAKSAITVLDDVLVVLF